MQTKLLGFEFLKNLYANDYDFFKVWNTCDKHLVTLIGMRDFYIREINYVCLFVLFVSCWLGKVMEVV